MNDREEFNDREDNIDRFKKILRLKKAWAKRPAHMDYHRSDHERKQEQKLSNLLSKSQKAERKERIKLDKKEKMGMLDLQLKSERAHCIDILEQMIWATKNPKRMIDLTEFLKKATLHVWEIEMIRNYVRNQNDISPEIDLKMEEKLYQKIERFLGIHYHDGFKPTK